MRGGSVQRLGGDGANANPVGKIGAGQDDALIAHDITGVAYHDGVVQPVGHPAGNFCPTGGVGAGQQCAVFSNHEQPTVETMNP